MNLWFAFASAIFGYAAQSQPYGVLLLAHGGSPRWNREIAALRRDLEADVPTEVALGMADSASLNRALRRLERRGVGKIVAVPLFINSVSEVLDQTRYVLGVSDRPSELFRDAMADMAQSHGPAARHGHALETASFFERAKTQLPLVFTPALDSHSLVARMLLDRARALSRTPARETVVLVGHGPVDEEANEVWLETMRKLGDFIRERGKFKAVEVATIRDDSREEIKAKAAESLRALAAGASQKGGRALIIPHLVARGGIESHILEILKGLSYSWNGRTLAPDRKIKRWVLEIAAWGASQEDMRLYKEELR